jgi:hypothetical protein
MRSTAVPERGSGRRRAAGGTVAVGLVAALLGLYLSLPAASAPAAGPRATAASGGSAAAAPALPPAVPSVVPDMPADPDSILPRFAPRDPAEWQGMLVDVSRPALCGGAAACGLGLACIDHQCLPCSADDQCLGGEACVLDHCLPAAQVACRSHRDCPGAHDLCVLSGYSTDLRGTSATTATCLAPEGGREQSPASAPPDRPGSPAPPVPVRPGDLLDSL